MLSKDLVAEVPLAVVRGRVVATTEQLGQAGRLRGQRNVVFRASVRVRVEPREQRGPRRRAHGLRDVRLLEDGALLGQAVQIRHLDLPVPVGGQRPGRLLVGMDEQEVRRCH